MVNIDDWWTENNVNIDDWWTENNAPINLHTLGRSKQTSLNKNPDRDILLEIMKNNDRMRDFYTGGPVQRAAVEDFVDEIIKYISKP